MTRDKQVSLPLRYSLVSGPGLPLAQSLRFVSMSYRCLLCGESIWPLSGLPLCTAPVPRASPEWHNRRSAEYICFDVPSRPLLDPATPLYIACSGPQRPLCSSHVHRTEATHCGLRDMPTNIELAISAVLYRHKELTVHNVLVDYLRIIGYIEPDQKEATVPHDAVVAFEHALDKEPLLRRRCSSPDASLCTRMYTKEITTLRKEYWKEKLGSSSPVRCTCPTCGCTVAYEKDPEVVEDDDDVLAEKRRVRRLKIGRRESGRVLAVGLEPDTTEIGKAKTRRVAKRLRDTTRANIPLDPYGPSTSAFMM